MNRSRILYFLKRILYGMYLLQSYLWLEHRLGWKRSVLCICYHNIPLNPPVSPISDLEAGTCAATFETQIKTYSRWLKPINDLQLVDWLEGNASLERDGLLVTFDDGYRDNLTVAGPILKKYGVPGLIFVATDYVETGRQYWWTRLSDAIRNIDQRAWKSLAKRRLPDSVLKVIAETDLATSEGRLNSRRRCAQLIERDRSLEPVLDVIESAANSSGPSSLPILSWDEISQMNRNGFSFGCHTHSHPRLSRLDDERIAGELKTSRKLLLEHLGGWPLTIAYPSGDYDQRAANLTKAAGFKLAFTTKPAVILKSSERMELPRVYIGSSEPHALCFALCVLSLTKYLPRLEQQLLRLAY